MAFKKEDLHTQGEIKQCKVCVPSYTIMAILRLTRPVQLSEQVSVSCCTD